MELKAKLVTTIVMNGKEASAMHHLADRAVAVSKGHEANMGRAVTDESFIKIASDFAKVSGEAAELHGRFEEAKEKMNLNDD